MPIREWLFFPISAPVLNFNPQKTQCIPAVEIFAFLRTWKNDFHFRVDTNAPSALFIYVRIAIGPDSYIVLNKIQTDNFKLDEALNDRTIDGQDKLQITISEHRC